MNPPAQDFEQLIRKTVAATGLEKLIVKVPVTVPLYRRKSLGWSGLVCSFLAIPLCLFIPLTGFKAISPGYFLLGAILSFLSFGSFWACLFVTDWFIDSFWEVTASRDTFLNYFTYSARVGEYNLFSTETSLAGLMAEKRGVTPSVVAEAFANALQQVSADKFQMANDRLSTGLEKHKILKELEGK